VWAADFSFGETAGDLRTLAHLGALAARAGAPLVAAASPHLLGVESFAAQPDPGRWTGPPHAVLPTWTELRRSRVAPWIALVAPRMLLRLPYGAKTMPAERFAFEEMPVRSHTHYLWGHGIWAAAEVLGRTFVDAGGEMRRPGGEDVGDLPVHVYTEGGETQAQATAEAYLTERAADRLLAEGISPMLSVRGRDAARLVQLRSIAGGSPRLEGPWAD
jgi:type VI secretion system protein ImpC